MGLISGSFSFSRFKVGGEPPKTLSADWAAERMAKTAFRSIEESTEERSAGFVLLDDPAGGGFEKTVEFFRRPYLCFAMREDERKVPGSLLKQRLLEESAKWLAEQPGLKKMPRVRRIELKEILHQSLLSRALPTPSFTDIVWNTDTGELLVGALGQKKIDLLGFLFERTFENLTLEPEVPFRRAMSLLEKKQGAELEKLNRASSDSAIDLLKDNRWLGREFLLWLTHRSAESSSDYKVSRKGPAQLKEGFNACVDSRVVLVGELEAGATKLSASGPQDSFEEVKAGLKSGKQISEAAIHFTKGDETWKMTLKSERFQISALRTPKVKLEKDEITDEAAEREAVFYEKMSLVETALQMFDSLLGDFLAERLSPAWEGRLRALEKWSGV